MTRDTKELTLICTGERLRVRHPGFGAGTGLGSSGSGAGQKLRIRLDHAVVKAAIVGYANLDLG